MTVESTWFIGARVRRLPRVLQHIPSTRPGLQVRDLVPVLKEVVDGPRAEIPILVEVLVALGHVRVETSSICLSNKGKRALTLSNDRARTELSEQLIQSGMLHDQVRLLVEHARPGPQGTMDARLGPLRRDAPQLVALLQAWPNCVGRSVIRVPIDLYETFDTPWSLIPLPRSEDGAKKALGSRAEAYSYHFLRKASAHPGYVSWVARDDESLGYDIEDRSGGRFRRVEVKGSQGSVVQFFVSENEHDTAHLDSPSYEIHFWGNINLNRDPRIEFDLLRSSGYPLVFVDYSAHLARGTLVAVPKKYRVTLDSGARETSFQSPA